MRNTLLSCALKKTEECYLQTTRKTEMQSWESLMFSTLLLSRGLRELEYSYSRVKDTLRWLDIIKAAILIRSSPGYLMLCCDFSHRPQKFPAAERFMSLCFVFSYFCWEWWNLQTFLLNLHKLWYRVCSCHPFLRKLYAPLPHTHIHSVYLPFPHCRLVSWWRLCHSVLITRREVSASSLLHHSDCDSSSTLC